MTDVLSADRTAAAQLQEWIEGRAAPDEIHDRVDVLLGPESDKRVINESAALQTARVVFAPRDADVEHPRVVAYDGEFSLTGAEIGITNDLFIQVESYATAPYVPVATPTAISIVDEADLRSLSADVDRALVDGVFPAHLLGPYVTFLDLAAWLRADESKLPVSRLYFDGAMGWCAGPSGEQINIEDGLGGLARRLSVAAAAAEPHDRARFSRFVGAVRSLQLASLRVGGQLRVAGFGASFFGIEQTAIRSGAPYVLASDEGEFFVAQPRVRRFGRVQPQVAEAVLAHLAGESLSAKALSALGLEQWSESAAEVLFRRLGIR